MLPVFREVSKLYPAIRCGTVDCTTETALCSKYGINSYPSPIFFRNGDQHHFQGDTSDAASFTGFIEDMYDPPVIDVTPAAFESDLIHEPETLWVRARGLIYVNVDHVSPLRCTATPCTA